MISIFQSFSTQFDGPITTGVSKVVQSGISAVAAPLATALSIYIIIHGILVMFGKMDFYAGMTAALRASIIGALLTATYYQQYVTQPFLTDIPNWIASATSGVTGTTAGAQQFDTLFSAVEHLGAATLEQAGDFTDIDIRIEVVLITWGVSVALGIAYVIYELARMFMALAVCAGPFIVGFYLFAATRAITLRWIGFMVSVLLLGLLVSVLLQLMLAADSTFMLQAQSQAGAGLAEQVETLADILAFFLMSALLTIFIPTMAGSIGGGILPGLGSIVVSPFRLAGKRRLPCAGF